MWEKDQTDRRTVWNSALRYSASALGILFIVLYVVLVLFRIRYPFELEWMEGGSVDHVCRILAGEKLYVSPSLEFVPFIYPPLYYYISALAWLLTGGGFLPLRLVSFVASLGCFVVIFQFVKREARSTFSGILAASLFAATFRISGAWFDLARVDSLFLLFLLLGFYFVRFKKSWKSYVIAGLFIGLSFLTKQAAFVIAIPIIVYCILLNWRASIAFVGTVVLIIGISTIALDYIHDGWYSYYVFALPSQHPLIARMFVNFWTKDLIAPLAIACVMSMFYMFSQVLSSTKEGQHFDLFRNAIPDEAPRSGADAYAARLNGFFYLFMAVGMIGGAWLSRLHSGGYANVLFPAYAVICILFGMGTHRILERIQVASIHERKFVEAFVYLVCIMQFAGLAYNPHWLIPTEKDLEAGREFVKTMAEMKGEVFVPFHAYLPTLAGKSSHAQGMAVADVLRGDRGQVGTKFRDDIREAIREKRFAAMILDESFFVWFLHDVFPQLREDIEENYVRQESIFDSDSVFWPVTGGRTRPEFVYVPRSRDFYKWPK